MNHGMMQPYRGAGQAPGTIPVPGDRVVRGTRKKDRTTAAVMAIVLGGIGMHKFYLDQWLWGILYVLFFWTWVPLVLGALEGITILLMSNRAFQARYGWRPGQAPRVFGMPLGSYIWLARGVGLVAAASVLWIIPPRWPF